MKKIFNREDSKKKCVVYGIDLDHKHNYIGKTKRTASSRWNEHWNSFSNGRCNKNFKKYLKPNSEITFYIIKQCKNDEQAIKLEKQLIKEYNPDLNVVKN